MVSGAVPELVGISVHPGRAELRGSKAQQTLLVTALYSNGVERDVTAQARFQVSAPDTFRISQSGVAFPLREGKARVKAAYQGKTAVAELVASDLAAGRTVSFLRDVSPIVTQKGCNGSNCHGSVRGKNGFKLSLFGARPDLDFEAILKADGGRRINRQKPQDSLLLRKPTFTEPHGGGQRFPVGSIEYRTILDWIVGGLVYESGGPELQDLQVHPGERILVGSGARQRLVVTGVYSDASRADLSLLVRYTSNDESVADVSEQGEVTAKRPGETGITIRTRGKVAVAKIAVIKEPPGAGYPSLPAHNFIDTLVFAKLKKLNIVPSPLSEDSVFLRRVYLDTLGTLPTLAETRRFLASTDPQKRSRLIDDLLSRPEFVELWALKFADLFQMGNSGVKGGWQFHRWIRQALAENRPFDQIVREMILSGGAFVYDPTVNFYRGLWTGPEGMVTQISQSLLGIRMDCAKCHDHPFERWTQDDFYGLVAFFTRLEFKAESYGLFERAIAVRPTTRPTYDYINNNKEVMHPKTQAPLRARFLGGSTVEARPDEDIREKLADWLTSPNNPWFSKAIANRVWKHYLARGIVEPVDDFRVTNPPTNEALLNALGDYLAREKYDLRKLMKAILSSQTYQLSSSPNSTNESDDLNYSRFYLKRQMAEVLLDSMSDAAEAKVKIPGFPLGTRAVSIAVGSPNYFLMTFGKVQAREQICERDHEPNVTQAMHLINGDAVNDVVKAPGNLVERVLARTEWSDEQRIEEIYFASLARPPASEEKMELRTRLAAAPDDVARKKLYQDLLWAVLNSQEFAYIY